MVAATRLTAKADECATDVLVTTSRTAYRAVSATKQYSGDKWT